MSRLVFLVLSLRVILPLATADTPTPAPGLAVNPAPEAGTVLNAGCVVTGLRALPDNPFGSYLRAAK